MGDTLDGCAIERSNIEDYFQFDIAQNDRFGNHEMDLVDQ